MSINDRLYRKVYSAAGAVLGESFNERYGRWLGQGAGDNLQDRIFLNGDTLIGQDDFYLQRLFPNWPSRNLCVEPLHLEGFGTWTRNTAEVGAVAGQPDPRGAAQAVKLTELTTGFRMFAITLDPWAIGGVSYNEPLPGEVWTFSVEVKANERQWCFLAIYEGSVPYYAWFNVATGALGSVTPGVFASQIEALGGGWYRVGITRQITNDGTRFLIGMADADGSVNHAGVVNSGMTFYGAGCWLGAAMSGWD